MTSVERSSTTTGRPTGTWISLAVVTQLLGTESGYCTSHHHWWPVTRTGSAPGPGDAVTARPTEMSRTRKTNRITTVTPVATPTDRFRERSVAGVVGSSSARLRRNAAQSSAAVTSTKTTSAVAYIGSQSCLSIAEASVPAGARAECAPGNCGTAWSTVTGAPRTEAAWTGPAGPC